MKQLTKEQYEYLNQFEDRFICATKSNYCRNVQRSDLENLKNIYEDLIEDTYRMSMSCSTCILNLIKRLAIPYFEYQTNNNGREETGIQENRETEKGRRKGRPNNRSKN